MNNQFYSDLVTSQDIRIMGILNVTPDSFSDGGKYFNRDEAVEHALKMIDEGADIIDIGGESSRPGANEVPLEEEINRTIPVVENILKFNCSAIISIDTAKPQVAELAMQKGAQIINDIRGLADLQMLEVAKRYSSVVVIMHMQGKPKTMQKDPKYLNVVDEVFDFISEKVNYAQENGVEQLIVDPGIGFGKSASDNFILIKNLKKFAKLHLPILIGVSKKSLIGVSLDLALEERDIASVILETASVNLGAKIIRTHNVKNGYQIKKINSYLRTPGLLL